MMIAAAAVEEDLASGVEVMDMNTDTDTEETVDMGVMEELGKSEATEEGATGAGRTVPEVSWEGASDRDCVCDCVCVWDSTCDCCWTFVSMGPLMASFWEVEETGGPSAGGSEVGKGVGGTAAGGITAEEVGTPWGSLGLAWDFSAAWGCGVT